MSAIAIDPRNWNLDRANLTLPDQNPSSRYTEYNGKEEIVSRETIPDATKIVVSNNATKIVALLPPSSTPFVLANTARFRRCSCSAGFADTCGLRSDRRKPPTFGCKPVDWFVPERFYVASAGDRINPAIRTWIQAMLPTRGIDRNLIRFIAWMSRPTAKTVTKATVKAATTTTPPATRKATRDSILSEIERTLDIIAVTE